MPAGKQLREMFYRAYDASLITSFLGRLVAISQNERRSVSGFLGEGIHFQSFEVECYPMPLAVNVAKASFSQRGEAAMARWEDAIRRARSLEGDSLIPPMDVVKASGLTAIVMPKGNLVSQGGDRVIGSMLLETSRALGQAGLVLDDYPQVREALGVPFIVDWSDLTSIVKNAR
ncbi:MAG: hypothetical protein WCO71_02185 [Pseudomonadota bacterium]